MASFFFMITYWLSALSSGHCTSLMPMPQPLPWQWPLMLDPSRLAWLPSENLKGYPLSFFCPSAFSSQTFSTQGFSRALGDKSGPCLRETSLGTASHPVLCLSVRTFSLSRRRAGSSASSSVEMHTARLLKFRSLSCLHQNLILHVACGGLSKRGLCYLCLFTHACLYHVICLFLIVCYSFCVSLCFWLSNGSDYLIQVMA